MTKEQKKLLDQFADNMVRIAIVKCGKFSEETSPLSYMNEGYSEACFEYGYKLKMLITTLSKNQQTKRKKQK